METNTIEKTQLSSTNLLVMIFKWRKLLLIILACTAILSSIFSSSFFIKPKYKSTVILFPTSTNSVSQALLSTNSTSNDNILQFGEEAEAEQILQILTSNEIRNKIITKFHLFKHYDIDSTTAFKNTLISQEYDENISFRRTEFLSIEIKVLDTKPQMAADIANEISNLIDSAKNDILRKTAYKGLEIVENEYNNLTSEIDKLDDSLRFIRSKGVLDYESQAEVMTEQLSIAVAKNNAAGVRALQSKLDTFSKYSGYYVSCRDNLEYKRKRQSELKEKLEEARVNARLDVPHKFVVDRAEVAEKKCYPIRWLIVLISCMSTMLLSVLVISTIEYFKKTDIS